MGADFRQFVKNILSKDYSAANSMPFQIMDRKTMKIFAKIWRNCPEHERACLRIFYVHVFNMVWPLEQNHKIGRKKKELKKFVDEKSYFIGSKNHIFQFEICEISPKKNSKVALPGSHWESRGHSIRIAENRQ